MLGRDKAVNDKGVGAGGGARRGGGGEDVRVAAGGLGRGEDVADAEGLGRACFLP